MIDFIYQRLAHSQILKSTIPNIIQATLFALPKAPVLNVVGSWSGSLVDGRAPMGVPYDWVPDHDPNGEEARRDRRGETAARSKVK